MVDSRVVGWYLQTRHDGLMCGGEILSSSRLCGELKSSSEINGNDLQGYGLHSNEMKDGLTNVVQRVCKFNECAVDSIGVQSNW